MTLSDETHKAIIGIKSGQLGLAHALLNREDHLTDRIYLRLNDGDLMQDGASFFLDQTIDRLTPVKFDCALGLGASVCDDNEHDAC